MRLCDHPTCLWCLCWRPGHTGSGSKQIPGDHAHHSGCIGGISGAPRGDIEAVRVRGIAPPKLGLACPRMVMLRLVLETNHPHNWPVSAAECFSVNWRILSSQATPKTSYRKYANSMTRLNNSASTQITRIARTCAMSPNIHMTLTVNPAPTGTARRVAGSSV